MSSRYRLTRRLAAGGMAEVFVGVASGDEGFEKPVAVKRMLPHLLADERMSRMFLSEARLARYLHHQNIVSVFDVGRGRDGVFLVMEVVDGWDLRTLRLLALERSANFPPHLAAWIVAQVNAGLLHAYGKVVEGKPLVTAHRDVSDSNVLVSREGEVKVADFGIARVELFGSHTEPGTFKGRISYAAPELLGGGAPSAASDQFSLGVLFHELLTGNHPWGEAQSLADYMLRIRTTPPDLTRAPPDLSDILAKMLVAAPEKRLAPQELSRLLGGYLATCGQAAGPHELAAFVRTLSPPPTPLELPEDPSLQEPRRGGAPWFELEGEPWEKSPDASPASGARLDRFGLLGTDHTVVPGSLPELGALADDAPLELARDITRVAPPEPPPPRRVPVKRLVALLVAGALAGAGYLYWPQIHRRMNAFAPGAFPAQRTHVLTIDSEPEGAGVFIDGKGLGLTPLLLENDYPPREIEIELRRPGYVPWKGSFAGRQEATVKATLVRARGGR